jgi:hypothetical protein
MSRSVWRLAKLCWGKLLMLSICWHDPCALFNIAAGFQLSANGSPALQSLLTLPKLITAKEIGLHKALGQLLNKTLVETATSILQKENLSQGLWPEAIPVVTYLNNRSPRSCLRVWHSMKPGVEQCLMWGTSKFWAAMLCFCAQAKELRSNKSIQGAFVRYEGTSYRVWVAAQRSCSTIKRHCKALQTFFLCVWKHLPTWKICLLVEGPFHWSHADHPPFE